MPDRPGSPSRTTCSGSASAWAQTPSSSIAGPRPAAPGSTGGRPSAWDPRTAWPTSPACPSSASPSRPPIVACRRATSCATTTPATRSTSTCGSLVRWRCVRCSTRTCRRPPRRAAAPPIPPTPPARSSCAPRTATASRGSSSTPPARGVRRSSPPIRGSRRSAGGSCTRPATGRPPTCGGSACSSWAAAHPPSASSSSWRGWPRAPCGRPGVPSTSSRRASSTSRPRCARWTSRTGPRGPGRPCRASSAARGCRARGASSRGSVAGCSTAGDPSRASRRTRSSGRTASATRWTP